MNRVRVIVTAVTLLFYGDATQAADLPAASDTTKTTVLFAGGAPLERTDKRKTMRKPKKPVEDAIDAENIWGDFLSKYRKSTEIDSTGERLNLDIYEDKHFASQVVFEVLAKYLIDLCVRVDSLSAEIARLDSLLSAARDSTRRVDEFDTEPSGEIQLE